MSLSRRTSAQIRVDRLAEGGKHQLVFVGMLLASSALTLVLVSVFMPERMAGAVVWVLLFQAAAGFVLAEIAATFSRIRRSA